MCSGAGGGLEAARQHEQRCGTAAIEDRAMPMGTWSEALKSRWTGYQEPPLSFYSTSHVLFRDLACVPITINVPNDRTLGPTALGASRTISNRSPGVGRSWPHRSRVPRVLPEHRGAHAVTGEEHSSGPLRRFLYALLSDAAPREYRASTEADVEQRSAASRLARSTDWWLPDFQAFQHVLRNVGEQRQSEGAMYSTRVAGRA